MLAKTKKFFRKHKEEIFIITGGVVIATAGVLLGWRTTKSPVVNTMPPEWLKAERAFLEGFGAVCDNGFKVSKEVAIKYLEETGNTYELDIFDLGKSYQNAVIWISKSVD